MVGRFTCSGPISTCTHVSVRASPTPSPPSDSLLAGSPQQVSPDQTVIAPTPGGPAGAGRAESPRALRQDRA